MSDKILHFLCCCGIALVLYPIIGWWSVGAAVAAGVGELYDSIKNDHKPSMAEMFGASIFGTLVAAFIIYGIHLIVA